jgi:hypothetical protein
MNWERFKGIFRGEGERGTSLIEVLVALLIFLFLMIGVLQMFVLAYLVNQGSAARTEMTYKAQQVMENMKFLNSVYKHSGTMPANLSPVAFPLTDGASYDLSTLSASDLTTSYWGPTVSDIMETADPRYDLVINVASGGTTWIVTVSARPSTSATGPQYIHGGGKYKEVDYVAELPQ